MLRLVNRDVVIFTVPIIFYIISRVFEFVLELEQSHLISRIKLQTIFRRFIKSDTSDITRYLVIYVCSSLAMGCVSPCVLFFIERLLVVN